MDFAELLTSIRGQHGLTQAELAARLGLSHASVGRIENGKIRPSVKTGVKIKALAKELGIPVGSKNTHNNAHDSAPSDDPLIRVITLWERDKDEAAGREVWMRDLVSEQQKIVFEQQKINGTQAAAIHKFSETLEHITTPAGTKAAQRKHCSA